MNILEISLLSNDIAETKDFYNGLLGLKILNENSSSISFQAGASKLTFNHIYNSQPVYHFAFNIPANQLDRTLKYLQTKTEIIPVPDTRQIIMDFKSWNAKSFYFFDNNGNILECIARFDLPNHNPEWNRLSFILNISEMGFVVEKVPDAEKLLEHKGIPLFAKGPQYADFSVLGDDNGLIILTDMTRGWMPHHLSPNPFWTKISVLQNQTIFEVTLTDHLQINL
jgi:catechol 2,3-dioxygenase-like lactoylglutathione lyase family enzyme